MATITQQSANPATTKVKYDLQMKGDLENQIQQLTGLSDYQKYYLSKRWLDQLVWMADKAGDAQRYHYWTRSISIICGALMILLANLAFDNKNSSNVIQTIQWMFNIVGLVAFLSFAAEGLFKFGEKWQHYRRTVEVLKSEGWKFIALSNEYSSYGDRSKAFDYFSGRIEEVFSKDIDDYIKDVALEDPTN